ncbi:hypothetical protein [Goodfellowiella coeruleoviolacea]|uniref:Uncharacterized protein n=1 Tax=Goodfellowiella coeruleoviolacea TaxID=334858 RepID=A0AAE3GAJ0_9PSEU|nr:hypothetical protein [Goodfellowiella coeruleoviolacea]MCP2163439.1 hypothetical protein [Goodfellowiella coeruleoviolacea]
MLNRLVGADDASALMTGLREAAGAELVSLGPVLGLAQLRRGEIDRDSYVRAWGHRCPDEFEISAPRPVEDPDWLDRQLDRAAARARTRERARSEFARGFWVLRAFVVRAGELTGRGDDLFLLSIDEILAVLGGDEAPLASVPSRRARYERYRALPPYPTLIRGRFDPQRWAADPHRRTDRYDATAAHGGRWPRRSPAFPARWAWSRAPPGWCPQWMRRRRCRRARSW